MMTFASRFAEKYILDCVLHELSSESESENDLDSPLRSHSAPFVVKISPAVTEYYVKPRFISYYEVEIRASVMRRHDDNSNTSLPSLLQHIQQHEQQQQGAGITETAEAEGFECVAIGLATKSFMKNKRLPGWDSESYGYHGDDGAIFHGQGRQLSEFGPRYGCNDVIGCGLNHRDASIFFTLNGKMLGTAFTGVSTDKELYPTVGIDSNCSVHFNFGMKPFQFSLVEYLEGDALAV